METRLIEARDAEALRTLRIRAVTEYPSAFGASIEEEMALLIEQVARQLSEGHPYSYWYGTFDNATLIGIVHLARFQRPKARHKTMLGECILFQNFRSAALAERYWKTQYHLPRL
jgi:hypothetical protein